MVPDSEREFAQIRIPKRDIESKPFLALDQYDASFVDGDLHRAELQVSQGIDNFFQGLNRILWQSCVSGSFAHKWIDALRVG